MVEPTGYTALDLIGFTDKGLYSGSANYVKNDIVHDSTEKMWRCLIDDTTGITPIEGVNWTAFISPPSQNPEAIGIGYGSCATAAATAAKEATLSGFNLKTNGYVSVKFTYDVPANATLNVNNTGTKAIYYQGAAITASVIKAGNIATFIYDGANFNLINLDSDSSEIEALTNNLSTEITNRQNADAAINDSLAIVQTGNTCAYSGGNQIPKGSYVLWKGTLCTANSDITNGTSFSSGSGGNLTVCTDGGFNSLNDKLLFVSSAEDMTYNSNVQKYIYVKDISSYITQGYKLASVTVCSGLSGVPLVPYIMDNTRVAVMEIGTRSSAMSTDPVCNMKLLFIK